MLGGKRLRLPNMRLALRRLCFGGDYNLFSNETAGGKHVLGVASNGVSPKIRSTENAIQKNVKICH